jgi:DNA topoisomerase-3
MTVDFPSKYNDWNRVDPSELFVCQIEKNEANPKMRMNSYLSGEAKGCDILVLWLDCDKEGENIAFEVISACKNSMNKRSGNIMDSVYRY